MRIGQTLAIALMLALVPAGALAASTQAQASVHAGITPDSALYPLKLAWNNIRLFFATNPQAKASVGLQIADEHLAELQAMVNENKTADAEVAAKEYNKTMTGVQKAIDSIETDGSAAKAQAAITTSAQIQTQLLQHYQHVIAVHDEILSRDNATMNATQYAHIEQVFSDIAAKAEQTDGTAILKSEHARTKAKVLLNLSDAQAQELQDRLENGTGLKATLESSARDIAARINERAKNARAETDAEFTNSLRTQLENIQARLNGSATLGINVALNHTANASERAKEQLQEVANQTTQRLENRSEGLMIRANTSANGSEGNSGSDAQATVGANTNGVNVSATGTLG